MTWQRLWHFTDNDLLLLFQIILQVWLLLMDIGVLTHLAVWVSSFYYLVRGWAHITWIGGRAYPISLLDGLLIWHGDLSWLRLAHLASSYLLSTIAARLDPNHVSWAWDILIADRIGLDILNRTLSLHDTILDRTNAHWHLSDDVRLRVIADEHVLICVSSI